MNPDEHFFCIQTPRLSIRPIRASDASDIFKLYSSQELMVYTDNKLIHKLSECEALIEQNLRLQQTRELIWCGITLKNSGEVSGTIRLYHFDKTHLFASIGCLLSKRWWNQGIMTEALGAFCKYSFAHLPINRIEAQIFKGNSASVKLFNKLNFTFEGELRENFMINGKLENSAVFSIIKSDILGL